MAFWPSIGRAGVSCVVSDVSSPRGRCADPMVKLSGCPRARASGAAFEAVSQVSQARQRLLRHPRPGAWTRPAQMEEEGHKIIKLNIGNLAAFGFEPPDEIVQDMIRNLPDAAGYTDSKGLFAPRKAVMHYTQQKQHRGRRRVDDVYLGNGASELIAMSMNALLDDGDEVLIPAPDYPLWTAAVGAVGRHAGALPVRRGDGLAARPRRHPRARSRRARAAIVVINPNNPTGALYPDELLQRDRRDRAPARADRLRRRDLRQDALRRRHAHHRSPSLADDVLFLTFNGLSKNYRSCGYRAGWMVVSGDKRHAARLHRGPEHAGLDAPVRQRAGPARDPDRARRLPEHQRPGRRRAAACAASATSPTSCSPRSRA